MHIPNHYDFLCPSKILSGDAALENLPTELQALNADKPLIVASAAESRAGGVKRVLGAFAGSAMPVGVFEEAPESADPDMAARLAKSVRDRGTDALVVVGAGAVVDLAKGIRLAAAHPDGELSRAAGENGAPIPLMPAIQVVTEPGTGLEASRFSRLGQVTVSDAGLMPNLVLLDPRTVRLADGRSAAESALGSLTRAAEACCGIARNPMIDTYGHAAIGLVAEYLRTALDKPQDAKAKMALANASVMAAVAFSNAPAGPAHRLTEAGAASAGISPPVFMGLVLPYSLGWLAEENRDAVGELLLPLAGFDRYADTSSSRRAEAAIERLFELLRWMEPAGIIGPLRRNGLNEADVAKIAADAAAMAPVMPEATVARILHSALQGGPVAVAAEPS